MINSGSGSGTLRLGRKPPWLFELRRVRKPGEVAPSRSNGGIPLLFEQKGLKQVVWNVRLKKWLFNGRAASYLVSLDRVAEITDWRSAGLLMVPDDVRFW